MATEATGTQLAQRGTRGEVAALAGSFGLAMGDSVIFVDEVIGPQLIRFAEKGVADEGQEDVLTQLA